MTETGWIIAGVIAVIAVALILFLMRRKPDAAPSEPVSAPLAAPTPTMPVVPVPTSRTPEPSPLAPVVTPEVEEPAPAPSGEEMAAPLSLSGALDENVAPAPVPNILSVEGDDLRRLKGVGPKIVSLLHGEGITRYAQIAAWTDADLAAINAKLGSFAGRPQRDSWVEQARFLAAGDVAGYEAKFGKL